MTRPPAPRWALGAAAVLVLSALLPFEVDRGRPVFLWQAIAELRAPAAVAALAPATAGVIVGAAAIGRCRHALLASIAAAASAAVLVLGWIAGSTPAWDLLALPSSWTAGSALPVLGIGLCAAGARAAPRASRGLLAAGAALVALFYALPVLGEAPLASIVRLLAATRPGRPPLPAALLAVFSLWPAAIVAFACARRASRVPARFAMLASVLPVVMLPLVYRSITGVGVAPLWIPRLAGAAVVLGALVQLLAGALAALAAAVPRRVEAVLPLVAALVVVAAQVAAARAAPAPRPWPTRAGTEAQDHLFGDLLPAWNDAQAWGSDRGGDEAARAIAAARAVDPALAGALEALARGTADPDLTERRWYRLVDALDEASRFTGLPYYVDPTEIVVRDDRAWFRMDTYRIREAKALHLGDRTVVALHLSAMSPARTNRDLLGLSRDDQALALVALDAIDRYRGLIERLARETPPRCRDADRPVEDAADPARRCGELLRSLVSSPDLGDTLVAMVERHEAQHQLDGPRLRRPRLVRDRLDAYDPSVVTRVNRELSAYVAETAAAGAAPRLTLVRLVQLALGPKGVERLAAALALEALAGAPVEPQEALQVLASLGDDGLRRRAAEAWRQLYEERLPEQ